MEAGELDVRILSQAVGLAVTEPPADRLCLFLIHFAHDFKHQFHRHFLPFGDLFRQKTVQNKLPDGKFERLNFAFKQVFLQVFLRVFPRVFLPRKFFPMYS
jgi:hypothetical protein